MMVDCCQPSSVAQKELVLVHALWGSLGKELCVLIILCE
jgi:hypothetical protein